jgi:octanoyl-[GcvH]:protein N-octanoyltransferase
MHVLRRRAGDIAADRRMTRDLLTRAAVGEPGVRVWRPHRQVAFGPRDRQADGYETAREAARERDYEPIERDVGGRAVAYTGRTIAFARTMPIEDEREGLEERYASVRVDVRDGLEELGADVELGEPEHSFCPGTQSLQVDGRKLVGMAQRVQQKAALVAGIVPLDDHEEIAAVLDPVYEALDVPFDPETVGSIETAGIEVDPVHVIQTLEDSLVGDHLGTVEWVDG